MGGIPESREMKRKPSGAPHLEMQVQTSGLGTSKVFRLVCEELDVLLCLCF